MSRLANLLKKLLLLLTLFVVALTLLRLALFKGPILPPSELPHTPVLDMHVHVAGLGYGNSGCFIADSLKDSYKFGYFINAFGVSEKEIAARGDQYLIKKLAQTIDASKQVHVAIVLAIDGVVNSQGELDKEKTQLYIPNDYLAKETAKYPSLYFGASINPYRHDALQRLEIVKAQGAKLIKWIPNIQLIDPGDKRLIPFYKKMKALGLPLLSHTGQERSFGDVQDLYGDPRRLELPLSLGVTVIAAHMATTGETSSEDNYQRILDMFAKYPNLYSGISSLTQINKLGYLDKTLSDPRTNNRLLYGSDSPLINMVLVSAWYFPLNLTFKQMWEIEQINNPWDRDIALKQALGVPTDVFARSAELFDVH